MLYLLFFYIHFYLDLNIEIISSGILILYYLCCEKQFCITLKP